MTDQLQHKIRMLPDSPGCYLMKSEGKIIYIGKAKNLKNRVRQYFHGRPPSGPGPLSGRVRGAQRAFHS